MRKLLILASAMAVLALPVAATAKDHGNNGQGNSGHGNSQANNGHGNSGQSYNQYERSDRDDRDDGGRQVKSKRYGCPPGLAKKHNGCMAPGQARKIGQRSPWSSNRYVDYNSLPAYYRERYADTSGQRYYYEGNRVYTIDPTTQLIRGIINIIR